MFYVFNMEDIKKRKKTNSNTYCCVRKCTSKTSKNPELSFHRFPKKNERIQIRNSKNKEETVARRVEWMKRLRMGKISRRMVVCSKHFRPEDFLLGNTEGEVPKQHILKSTAVPSTNLPLFSLEKRKIISKKEEIAPKKKESPVLNGCEDKVKLFLTLEQRMQLEEQIRMYVQLLTQAYLLSVKNPIFEFLNKSSKEKLMEIKNIALKGNNSFLPCNLDDAIAIVKEYENKHLRTRKKRRSSHAPSIAYSSVKNTILNSKVFLYPDLLPKCGLHNRAGKKPMFSQAEDYLIALGLERFSSALKPERGIHLDIMPCKTEQQIYTRIKNVKAKCRIDNPIKYYDVHKKAPPLPRILKPFDAAEVKPPRDFPFEMLPHWAVSHLRPVHRPESSPRKVTIKKPESQVVKYRLLLPRIIDPAINKNKTYSESILSHLSPSINSNKLSPKVSIPLKMPPKVPKPLKVIICKLPIPRKVIPSKVSIPPKTKASKVTSKPTISVSDKQTDNESTVSMLVEPDPQTLSESPSAVNSTINVAVQCSLDSNSEVCDVIKSELTDDEEASARNTSTRSGVKRTHSRMSGSFVKSNALQPAHYTAHKKKKIKVENRDEIMESVGGFPIKKEIMDEDENSSTKETDVLFPASDKNTKDSEFVSDLNAVSCNFPIKQEPISENEDSTDSCSITNFNGKNVKTEFDLNSIDCSEIEHLDDVTESVKDISNDSSIMDDGTLSSRVFVTSNALQAAHYLISKKIQIKEET